jgi:mannosylglycerate hydrolase
MARAVAVIPHTHWDREWYQPFEGFRHALVQVLDEVLDALDGGMPWFLLDGQMAMVDDYLEARPEAADRLRRLAGDGRLSLGPWYVLMDEFCVSGETIVRNLQLGRARAAELGEPMAVGYLPDMFGHIAQMPQLLRQAGMDHAVVWRGVPARVQRSAFWWRALDGSTVRAEYLPVGYGIGAHLPEAPADLLRRLHALEEELGDFLRGGDAVLLLNGGDHQRPQRHVPSLAAAADGASRHFDVSLVSLPRYLRAAPTDALPSWTGELRSAARANLLPGVLSNRTDLKRATAAAERGLERVAEPLAALWLADDWPGAELDGAWLQLVRNSAHDSICACSSDAVGRAVQARAEQVTATADAVTGHAMAAAAAAFAAPGAVVINPSARARSGLVELTVAGDAPAGAQTLERWAPARTVRVGRGRDLHRIVGELRRDGWLGDGWGSGLRLAAADGGLQVTFIDDRAAPPAPDLATAVAEAFARAGAGADRGLQVVVERRPATRVLGAVAAVAGYGWRAWRPEAEAWQVLRTPVEGDGGRLTNGLVTVEVDPGHGAFTLTDHVSGSRAAGLGHVVEDGDDGDTYTYSPPDVDQVVDRPVAVGVRLVEAGPVRGLLEVTRRYRWPAAVVAGQRCGEEEATVVTTLELRTGERMVRAETRFDNRVRDHRVRLSFDLPRRADSSTAECAFATVTRGLLPEPGREERAVATYPSRRFVSAGGLTVAHDGLLEYEVEGGGSRLSLTLLRATGILSKPAPAYRPNPAGPALPLEAPQMLGPVTGRVAVALDVDDPYALADQAWTELQLVRSPGGGDLGEEGQWLSVAGAEVSALRRVDGLLELRLFNPTDRPAVAELADRSGVVVDLAGEELGAWKRRVLLGPWAIATLLLDP